MQSYNVNKIWDMHRYPIEEVQRVLKDYDVRVICFGSTIKGTANWRSDVDLCYEVKNPEEDNIVHRLLTGIKFDIDYPQIEFDVIPRRLVSAKSPLYLEIEKGMIIVDFKE